MNAEETFSATLKQYRAELDRVDPEHEDGILGASVNQDAKGAVDGRVRDAAIALLEAGRAWGKDTSRW